MELLPDSYWHLADRNSGIFHNAFIGKGYIATTSVIANGELAGATTPYAFANGEQDKELLFEAIRQKDYPNRPSRIKTFYCFSSKIDAERAQMEWFHGYAKELIEVRIGMFSVIHTADSKLLDGGSDQWESSAHLYWQGVATDDPFMETIVHGNLFFPRWEARPFGLPEP